MHLKQALFVTAFSTVAIASPVDVEDRSPSAPRLADYYNVINLDDFDPNSGNSTLQKRVDWKWCVRNSDNGQKCFNVGFGVANLAGGIANIIFANSKNKDCSIHEGTIDHVQYQVHATGSNCDTTAQESTIEGGINTYLQFQDGAVCGVHCVQQHHGGGTYTGYLKIAPQGVDMSGIVCDSSVSFTDGCGDGGKKDV